MQDRQPGAPGQYKAEITAAELQKMQSGEQFVITMTRDDQPLVEGTPYNKASVLPDELAALICPDLLDPTPADAFRGLAKKTESLYPVGSIYLSATNVSPASFVGGTWEQIKDRFLLAAGSSYSAGSTGGEAAHTLTINEIPSHNHQSGGNGGAGTSGDFGGVQLDSVWAAAYTANTGGGAAHNNMPPYLAVYMWKRIA